MHSKETVQPVKIRSIKFNVLMNMILTSSQMLFPLITLPYVSRILSTYGTGAVAFVQSALTYFSLVSLLGVQTYGIKVCAAVRDNRKELSKTVKELLVILLISTTVVFAVYLICMFTVPKFIEQKALFAVFAVGLWLAAFGVEWFYRALEQYGYIAIRNVAFKFIGLILMFLFVRQREDYVVYGMIVVFTGYGMNLLNIFRLRKLVDLSIKTKLDLAKHVKNMFYYSVASITSGMYTQTDTLMLGFLGTTDMVGLYQLVSKIKNVLIQAVNSVGNVMLPRMSYYKANHNSQSINRLMSKSFNFIGVVSALLIGGAISCSDSIVWLMGGPEFAKSAVPLVFAVPAVLFSSLNIMLGNELITESREKEWAVINVVGLVLAFIYAALFIPLLGVLGAALTNACTELTVLVMRSWRSRSMLKSISKEMDFGRIAIALLISVSITYGFKMLTGLQSGFAALCLYGGIYVVLYSAMLIIFREKFLWETITGIRKHK